MYLSNRKNLINLGVFVALVVGLLVGIYLVQQQQLLRSRASADQIVFSGPNVKNIGNKQVLTSPEVDIDLFLGPPGTYTGAFNAAYTFDPTTLVANQPFSMSVTPDSAIAKGTYDYVALLVDGKVQWLSGPGGGIEGPPYIYRNKGLSAGEHTFQMIAHCSYNDAQGKAIPFDPENQAIVPDCSKSDLKFNEVKVNVAAGTASAPSAPQVALACSNNSPVATFTWTGNPGKGAQTDNANAGKTGFYVDISEDANFGTVYNKFVEGTGTTADSSGFKLANDGPNKGNSLVLTPGKTYHVRVYNGQHSQGSNFTVTPCSSTPPSKPVAVTSCTTAGAPIINLSWTGNPGKAADGDSGNTGKTGFYVDISESSSFDIVYNRFIPAGSLSTDTLTGFVLANDGPTKGTPLTVTNGKTYYARVFNGQTSPTSDALAVGDCGAGATAKPTVSVNCVAGKQVVTINWTGTPGKGAAADGNNAGKNGFYVDINEGGGFSTVYNKFVETVSSTTSTTSDGFVFANQGVNQGTPLTLDVGKTYYIRTYNGKHSPTSDAFKPGACATTSTPSTLSFFDNVKTFMGGLFSFIEISQPELVEEVYAQSTLSLCGGARNLTETQLDDELRKAGYDFTKGRGLNDRQAAYERATCPWGDPRQTVLLCGTQQPKQQVFDGLTDIRTNYPHRSELHTISIDKAIRDYQAAACPQFNPGATPTPTPTPTNPGGGSGADAIKGYFDVAGCDGVEVKGWSCTSTNYNVGVAVEIYEGQYASGKQSVMNIAAAGVTLPRSGPGEGVANFCGGNANHGFATSMAQSLKDGKAHRLYAYGVASDGSRKQLNTNDGKGYIDINCSASGGASPTPPSAPQFTARYDMEPRELKAGQNFRITVTPNDQLQRGTYNNVALVIDGQYTKPKRLELKSDNPVAFMWATNNTLDGSTLSEGQHTFQLVSKCEYAANSQINDNVPSDCSKDGVTKFNSQTFTFAKGLPPVVEYRVSDDPSDFATNKVVFQPYKSEPVKVSTFRFRDPSLGTKTIFVQYKLSDGSVAPTIQKSIELVSKDPGIDSVLCYVNPDNSGMFFDIDGRNFGTNPGVITVDGVAIRNEGTWTDEKAKGILPNATDKNKEYTVNVTSSDGRKTADAKCRPETKSIALGAKLFCRQERQFNQDDVEITFVGLEKGGEKVKERVTVDKDGYIRNVKTKLRKGKKYAIAVAAPKSLVRIATFTWSDGTDVVHDFVLPVGDIYPDGRPDHVINAQDVGMLFQQWRTLRPTDAAKSGDFNRDLRINAVDYACMAVSLRGKTTDDTIPAAGPSATYKFSPENPSTGDNVRLTVDNTSLPEGAYDYIALKITPSSAGPAQYLWFNRQTEGTKGPPFYWDSNDPRNSKALRPILDRLGLKTNPYALTSAETYKFQMVAHCDYPADDENQLPNCDNADIIFNEVELRVSKGANVPLPEKELKASYSFDPRSLRANQPFSMAVNPDPSIQKGTYDYVALLVDGKVQWLGGLGGGLEGPPYIYNSKGLSAGAHTFQMIAHCNYNDAQGKPIPFDFENQQTVPDCSKSDLKFEQVKVAVN